MSFKIQAALRYTVFQRSSVLLNLHALSTPNQVLSEESFCTTPGVLCEFLPLEVGGNRYVRLDTCDVGQLELSYSVCASTSPDARRICDIESIPVGALGRDALPYLFPSRYCQSDMLGRLAFKQFGHIGHPLAQAAAISDWVFDNIDYLPGATDTATSARDTLTQRAGVCRDFAHLGIALCRALSIPARYFTGYACRIQPADFHACFEACVGNQWFIFDPTRLSSPNGLVRIATGRDAADASLATIFGAMQLDSLEVSCSAPEFIPLDPAELAGKAVLLEP